MSEATSNYLFDLGSLLKEQALDAKNRAAAASGTADHQFELGRLTGYYEVLSLMKQQAEAFGIPFAGMSLEGFEPDSDLLATGP